MDRHKGERQRCRHIGWQRAEKLANAFNIQWRSEFETSCSSRAPNIPPLVMGSYEAPRQMEMNKPTRRKRKPSHKHREMNPYPRA